MKKNRALSQSCLEKSCLKLYFDKIYFALRVPLLILAEQGCV